MVVARGLSSIWTDEIFGKVGVLAVVGWLFLECVGNVGRKDEERESMVVILEINLVLNK